MMPTPERPFMHWQGYIAKRRREQHFATSGDLVVFLVGLPGEATKFSHPLALGSRIFDKILVTRFYPVEASQFTHAKPDIHQISIVPRRPLPPQKVNVTGVH